MTEKDRYKVYILRCWSETSYHPQPQTHWRFALEDVHDKERQGYPSLAALIQALQEAMKEAP